MPAAVALPPDEPLDRRVTTGLAKIGIALKQQAWAEAGGRGLTPTQGQVLALLRAIGERYGKSPAQVALRWLIEDDTVLPIPGAKNGRQAADNAAALSFRLSADEVAALDRATRAWRGREG